MSKVSDTGRAVSPECLLSGTLPETTGAWGVALTSQGPLRASQMGNVGDPGLLVAVRSGSQTHHLGGSVRARSCRTRRGNSFPWSPNGVNWRHVCSSLERVGGGPRYEEVRGHVTPWRRWGLRGWHQPPLCRPTTTCPRAADPEPLSLARFQGGVGGAGRGSHGMW